MVNEKMNVTMIDGVGWNGQTSSTFYSPMMVFPYFGHENEVEEVHTAVEMYPFGTMAPIKHRLSNLGEFFFCGDVGGHLYKSNFLEIPRARALLLLFEKREN